MDTASEVVFNVISNGPAVIEKWISAAEAIKEGLHNVKVSRYDADELEREIEGDLFDKWEEKCEVMKTTQIMKENIIPFLDHMKEAYEGITGSIRKKMEGAMFSEGIWEQKLMEYRFNTGEDSYAKYGLIVFGRSPDLKYYDCMYVFYTMDFRLAKRREVVEKKDNYIFGLMSFTSQDVVESERKFGTKSTKAFQNFFRLKALQGFYKEGVIDRINYVKSLDDIPAE